MCKDTNGIIHTVLMARSIWTVLRLKERLVKLFMEHNARQHMGTVGYSAAQVGSNTRRKRALPTVLVFRLLRLRLQCTSSQQWVREPVIRRRVPRMACYVFASGIDGICIMDVCYRSQS